jgi:hypothetical protein
MPPVYWQEMTYSEALSALASLYLVSTFERQNAKARYLSVT